MSIAEVRLWGRSIGAVSWDAQRQLAHVEYTPEFVNSGIEVAPLTMPLQQQIYSFPALPRETFHGLPGLLADSLPDDFGNALINAWLASQGRSADSFNPVERLCYSGNRGMGALEYLPVEGPQQRVSQQVDIAALVELASTVLGNRHELQASFNGEARETAMKAILQVGTSAGGARAKAVIAWNPQTNDVRSGQVEAGQGYSYWLLKFDGVSGSRDRTQVLHDPAGFGLIEYAYYKMALQAGIQMERCRLLQENGRSHFMTQRFDRDDLGGKRHMLSLGAMKHFDYRQPGAYSYEQALQTIRELEMDMDSVEEQFRRMAFNIIARNQDDHVKNIAFLMNRAGQWSLSPAYDVTYSYNPDGAWTNSHQMTLNGKRDGFELDDFRQCASQISMRRGRVEDIIEQVEQAVRVWPQIAEAAGVPGEISKQIAAVHRLDFIRNLSL